ncbi:bromodomain-containing protein 4 [Sabethes cyaneus]|uniref:bromodomain-containing protein 4 n=1 Tax=Sabethes cyaneus TaxID=53552 RepID=UPI00237EB85B|nr:bromodomain-containing protein 4 [Sabethes cyaneus]
MMEKEPDSMAVTMKQDYAASEVYSTTSEAPPAYKIRQANSVKIARIVALTVIASSFILGSFMLASTYLQAKQSCDQMQTLDAVLNKELMLEAMQQELPKAQALIQDHLSADESNLQTIDREEKQPQAKQEPEKKESAEAPESEDDDDSTADGESDESADMNSNRVHIKLPLDLNLSELAHAMLRENQKSKMNCVVERRRSEEMVDSPSKTMRFPFGMELNTEPKKQKVTGERIAIFCETGNEPKNEDAEPVRQVLIPIPPVRAFGPITHLPQQMPPQTMMRQMPRPIFPIPIMSHSPPQMPPMPAQMMQAPHPENPMIRPSFLAQPQQMIQPPQPPQQQPQQPQPTFPQQMQPPRAEVRIQFQRIPIPEMIRPFLPPQLMRNGPEQPEVQIREVPLDMALQKVGLSADELKDIHEIAAQKFTEQLKQLIGEMADSDESEEETDSYRTTPAQEPASQHSDERELQEQQPPRPQEPEAQPQNNAESQILPMGRSQYARSLVNPINLPGKVVESSVSDEESERPHYVQPRSV